jgi:hypothetical protein
MGDYHGSVNKQVTVINPRRREITSYLTDAKTAEVSARVFLNNGFHEVRGVRPMEITIKVHPEEIPVRGNAIVSGDDAYDKQVEDKIIAARADGNVWAWCVVEVIGEIDGTTASDFLGACSYENEEAFKAGGYYEDMIALCREQIEEITSSKKYRVTITDVTLVVDVEASSEEKARDIANDNFPSLKPDIIFTDYTEFGVEELS